MKDMSEVVLELKDLKLSLSGVSILNGVSLALTRGSSTGLIGPNGSGKTTLFNCISGFHRQDSGEIFFCGQEISTKPSHERARAGMGRVFQSFGIFKEMTLLENMLVALESQDTLLQTFGFTDRRRIERSKEALRSVRLDAKANHKASSLSGGQMRLLEIARTLIFGAECILLDEPTAGVSPKMKDDIGVMLDSLRASGKTILIIEHDINFIERFTEQVLVLDQGRVAMSGPPAEVRRSTALREIYFGAG